MIVDTDAVAQLIDRGAQVVEVLPKDDYQREHIPGAISIPLENLTPEGAAQLDRRRPIVTYCYDHECDLSARAAALLISYGFEQVYDYADSKTAWLAAGRPVEGSTPDSDRAGCLADDTASTCHPDELIEDLGSRFDPELGICVVIDDERRVLGVVHERASSVGRLHVRDVMHTAPASVRPSILRAELAASMDRGGERYVLVTTSGGRLLGVLPRERLDRA